MIKFSELNQEDKTAIILFNLGGPDKLSSVQKFLFNLFNDKAIINLPQPFRFLIATLISTLRNKKSQNIYRQINNKSPLLEITTKQASLIETELNNHGKFKVFVAMRYWHPFSKEVMEKVNHYQPNKIILLPLYPQFSTTTSESSINDFYQEFKKYKNKLDAEIKAVCCYPLQPEFIEAHSQLIKQAIHKNFENKIGQFRFLFSAHGLPQDIIDRGDPYSFQAKKTTEAIIDNLAKKLNISINEFDYQLCYQSKVGPKKWTSPSLDSEIKRAIDDKKIPVIIPVSFVSDHSETLVELDIDYKNKAKELGAIDYIRVESLNFNQIFIKSLTKICLATDFSSTKKCFSFNSAIDLENIKNNCSARICPYHFTKCPNFDLKIND
ncbi:MAG: ferrochelatase [Rickettsiales bacterium]|nr:ferrochelatase [Rickettsiales bacterium]